MTSGHDRYGVPIGRSGDREPVAVPERLTMEAITDRIFRAHFQPGEQVVFSSKRGDVLVDTDEAGKQKIFEAFKLVGYTLDKLRAQSVGDGIDLPPATSEAVDVADGAKDLTEVHPLASEYAVVVRARVSGLLEGGDSNRPTIENLEITTQRS